MLFLSIARPDLIPEMQSPSFGIELRLDLFPYIDMEYLKNFIKKAVCPVLLTLRKTSQGGAYRGGEADREVLIEQLLTLEPAFFDLECDMRPKFLDAARKRYPKTKFILSYHNFQEIPSDLDKIFSFVQESRSVYRNNLKNRNFGKEAPQNFDLERVTIAERQGASENQNSEVKPTLPKTDSSGYFGIYKIAAHAHSTNDALRMLLFAKKHPNLSAICMGEKGQFARVLGPIAGNLIDYASVDSKEHTAPGQLTAQELVTIYRYSSLNENSAIYGLIGDPVERSPGHLYHNAIFQERHINAVYVKMTVKPQELSEFIALATAIGIRGLSVTTPLKEKILPFLDEMDPAAQKIGAINTLLFRKGRIIGTNTDGLGALDAIEKTMSVRGKKIVLIGAGGAARAIAFEAKVRGADVLILNRTLLKAKQVAMDMGCQSGGLDDIPTFYDVLINCSPDPMPIDPKKIRSKTVVMDIVYFPQETEFLKEAVLRKCHIIYGEEMFVNQAARQIAFWMGT